MDFGSAPTNIRSGCFIPRSLSTLTASPGPEQYTMLIGDVIIMAFISDNASDVHPSFYSTHWICKILIKA